MTTGSALPLTALERACGLIAGPQPGLPPALPPSDGRPARRVLEEVILDRLAAGPCFVSFSGGRDSSSVLAVAVHVARREGLAPPVPLTLRFPGVASTQETEWQDKVVAHLGLAQWERITVGPELDLLGDIACGLLQRHGLIWPPNALFHEPLFRMAQGGCLLTGLDGDGLFGAWRWERAQSVLARRVPLQHRDPARIALAVAPAPLRRLALRRRTLPPVSWLRPAAQQDFARLWVSETAAEPRRWNARLAWYGTRRYLHLAQHSLGLVAAGGGAAAAHPLAEPRFLAALASEGGTRGWGNRTAIMGALFGDLLPRAVIERRGKAEFGRAFWEAQARAFAEDWDGETGVDLDLVDPDALRAVWRLDNPWFASITPLHSAWLSTQA